MKQSFLSIASIFGLFSSFIVYAETAPQPFQETGKRRDMQHVALNFEYKQDRGIKYSQNELARFIRKQRRVNLGAQSRDIPLPDAYPTEQTYSNYMARRILQHANDAGIDSYTAAALLNQESKFQQGALSETGAAAVAQFTAIAFEETNDQLFMRKSNGTMFNTGLYFVRLQKKFTESAPKTIIPSPVLWRNRKKFGETDFVNVFGEVQGKKEFREAAHYLMRKRNLKSSPEAISMLDFDLENPKNEALASSSVFKSLAENEENDVASPKLWTPVAKLATMHDTELALAQFFILLKTKLVVGLRDYQRKVYCEENPTYCEYLSPLRYKIISTNQIKKTFAFDIEAQAITSELNKNAAEYVQDDEILKHIYKAAVSVYNGAGGDEQKNYEEEVPRMAEQLYQEQAAPIQESLVACQNVANSLLMEKGIPGIDLINYPINKTIAANLGLGGYTKEQQKALQQKRRSGHYAPLLPSQNGAYKRVLAGKIEGLGPDPIALAAAQPAMASLKSVPLPTSTDIEPSIEVPINVTENPATQEKIAPEVLVHLLRDALSSPYTTKEEKDDIRKTLKDMGVLK